LKEKLRNVYNLAQDFVEAEWMLADWCFEADQSKIPELKTMAKTIRTHIEGILAYWTTGGITSAAVEGFNNKIRWLIKQAYGYHDQEYFHLKIFDLPNLKIKKDL
jgi:transposase